MEWEYRYADDGSFAGATLIDVVPEDSLHADIRPSERFEEFFEHSSISEKMTLQEFYEQGRVNGAIHYGHDYLPRPIYYPGRRYYALFYRLYTFFGWLYKRIHKCKKCGVNHTIEVAKRLRAQQKSVQNSH